jgi:hypothetical protein
MATEQSNGQGSSHDCRSSQDFNKSRSCDTIQSRDKSQSREKRRSRDNTQSRSRSSRDKRRSHGPEQDQVVGRRRNQDPLNGLLSLILHFCLFFWLQLLLSIFWNSSNSSGDSRNSSGDSCNSSGDSCNSSGDSCNNSRTDSSNRSRTDSSSISCDNNCNELLPSKPADIEVRTVQYVL